MSDIKESNAHSHIVDYLRDRIKEGGSKVSSRGGTNVSEIQRFTEIWNVRMFPSSMERHLHQN